MVSPKLPNSPFNINSITMVKKSENNDLAKIEYYNSLLYVQKHLSVKEYLSISYKQRVSAIFKKEIDWLNNLWSLILIKESDILVKYAPYKIRIQKLVPKNKYTQGTYVAINQPDGTLDLHLNFDAISKMDKFPTYQLCWVIFHEFRHKIQMSNAPVQSVLNYPNWSTFNSWIQKISGCTEDMANHIFHELNPAEVDANIFACEMTGLKFNGNAFDITNESLSELKIKAKKI